MNAGFGPKAFKRYFNIVDPAVIQQLAQSAYAAQGSTPQELRDFLKADATKWEAVIKAANLQAE